MPNIQTIEVNRQVTGYHQITDLSSAIQCPGAGSVVQIMAENQNIRYRLDDVDPTASEGMLLMDGDCHTINIGDGNIPQIRLIEAAAGAILNVHAFR